MFKKQPCWKRGPAGIHNIHFPGNLVCSDTTLIISGSFSAIVSPSHGLVLYSAHAFQKRDLADEWRVCPAASEREKEGERKLINNTSRVFSANRVPTGRPGKFSVSSLWHDRGGRIRYDAHVVTSSVQARSGATLEISHKILKTLPY